MKEYQIKRDLLWRKFIDSEIDTYFEEIRYDDQGEITFKSIQYIDNIRFHIFIFLNNSASTEISYIFAKLDNPDKKDELLKLFNDINLEQHLFKIYIDSDNNITVDNVFMSISDNFDPVLIHMIMIHTLKSIKEDYYPRIMKTIWS